MTTRPSTRLADDARLWPESCSMAVMQAITARVLCAFRKIPILKCRSSIASTMPLC